MDSVFAFLRTRHHSAQTAPHVKLGTAPRATLICPLPLLRSLSPHGSAAPVGRRLPSPPFATARPYLHRPWLSPDDSPPYPSPSETSASTFAPLHRSFAPICTFALHVPPPATRDGVAYLCTFARGSAAVAPLHCLLFVPPANHPASGSPLSQVFVSHASLPA